MDWFTCIISCGVGICFTSIAKQIWVQAKILSLHVYTILKIMCHWLGAQWGLVLYFGSMLWSGNALALTRCFFLSKMAGCQTRSCFTMQGCQLGTLFITYMCTCTHFINSKGYMHNMWCEEVFKNTIKCVHPCFHSNSPLVLSRGHRGWRAF